MKPDTEYPLPAYPLEEYDPENPYNFGPFEPSCECVQLTEALYNNGIHMDCRKACKIHNHMPLSGKEEKYGQNWANSLEMCPRCCEAVPVRFVVVDHRTIEVRCRRCEKLKHKFVSLIKTIEQTELRMIIDG